MVEDYMQKYNKYKEKYLLLKNETINQLSNLKGVQTGGDKKVYHSNIENLSIKNNYFRKVLFTTKNMQLVVMSLLPDENIPLEIHKEHDQFIKIEKGKCEAIIGNTQKKKIFLGKGDCIIIPNNTT